MRNGKKKQNDAPFVPFYDMHAVTFVLPDEMADMSIAGLQWFILIPQLNHTGSHKPIDSHSKPYLHREKKNNGGFYSVRGKIHILFIIFQCNLTLYQTTKFEASPTAFADDKMIMIQTLKFVLVWEEKIVGKGENAGHQHFVLFPQCFLKLFFLELLKFRIVR